MTVGARFHSRGSVNRFKWMKMGFIHGDEGEEGEESQVTVCENISL